eukprot:104879-Amphidinium_carterae.2
MHFVINAYVWLVMIYQLWMQRRFVSTMCNEKTVQDKFRKEMEKVLRKEMEKVKSEMTAAVQSAAGSRDKLEQHYEKELKEAKRVIMEERTARQQMERVLETTNVGATDMSRQLEVVRRDIEVANGVRERYDTELAD